MRDDKYKCFGIYKITNLITGNFYIGSTTKSFKHRWKVHKTELNQNKHGNRHLQSSWLKHGAKSFLFEIVELVENPSAVLQQEQIWINKYWNDGKLYNIQPTAGSPISLLLAALKVV